MNGQEIKGGLMMQFKDWKKMNIDERCWYDNNIDGFLNYLIWPNKNQPQKNNLYYLTEKGHLHKVTREKFKELIKTNYFNFYLLNEEDYNNIKGMSKDALKLYYELEANFDD